MTVTLKEIAEKAGVSPATVSRSLNGKPGVKPETRERVLAAARELQYAPHMVARGLATSRTETIAYVVHQEHFPLDLDPFYSLIMRGIESELSQYGHHLIFTTIGDKRFRDSTPFKLISESRVDGVILAGPDVPTRFILELRQLGAPVLLVDNRLSNVQIDAVQSDNRQGGRLATEHLIEHGHQKIVALLGPQAWASSAERGASYCEAMEAAGLDPFVLHAAATTIETGEVLAAEALQAAPDLTAIFAANDAMALGAMRTLRRQERRVPEDVAMIGFDDIASAALCHPALSTVKVHKREMGRLAARRMMDLVSDEDGPPAQILLSTELVVRQSCGCQGQ